MRFIAASAVLSVVLWAVEKPGSSELHRGDEALRRGHYSEAIDHYLRARLADRKNPGVYRRLASVAERTGDFVNATSEYQQCLLIDGGDVECRRGIARMNLRPIKKTGRR